MGRSSTRLCAAWCLGVLALSGAGRAYAQTGAEPAPLAADAAAPALQADQDREARFLFEAGRTAYDAGRYREALGHFQHAYDLSQRPQLLYNVGQAADRPAVEARIKVLREVRAEKQAATAATAPTAEETAQAAPTLAAGNGLTDAKPPSDEDDDLLSKWWLWAAAGGVVAGVVVGVLIASSGGDGGSKVKGQLVSGSDGKVIVALEAP